ncbi:MAG: hypothetical protein COA68_16305 [Oceanobacter sp.]|nr:MAG: hypothetical protein COA68_16305 [Oceanobacter sp.]|tara:strand:- start:8224 stop:8424 length:201 start_codon:yes stop_codon:yes gene_type:complete
MIQKAHHICALFVYLLIFKSDKLDLAILFKNISYNFRTNDTGKKQSVFIWVFSSPNLVIKVTSSIV